MKWPEEDWERRTAYVAVDESSATRLLGERVTAVQLLRGGKANTNYLIHTPGRSLVLRIYERDPATARLECNIAELVRGAVPVPAFVGPQGEIGQHPAIFWEFIEGQHPEGALGDTDAFALGEALGDTLRALEDIDPPGGGEIGLLDPDLGFKRTFTSVGDSFHDLVSWSLSDGNAGRRLGPDLRHALLAELDNATKLVDTVDKWRGLVHGDYKFSNLLVADDTVAAVLDWEFASVYTPLLDVAIHMRHRESFPAEYVAGFVLGHGSLPDDWEVLSRIIDLMNLVGFLNGGGERPRLYAAVHRLIEQTVAMLRSRR